MPSIHRSEHDITVVSRDGALHPLICWMHRNNTQYILFDIQLTYRFQKSNIPRPCKCGFVNRGLTTVNTRRIPVYYVYCRNLQRSYTA